jgi:hypothetical protein
MTLGSMSKSLVTPLSCEKNCCSPNFFLNPGEKPGQPTVSISGKNAAWNQQETVLPSEPHPRVNQNTMTMNPKNNDKLKIIVL